MAEPVSSPHARITRAEFARRIGVNRKTVTKWIQNGRLTLGDDGLLDFETANRERLATESPLPKHQARKAQFEEERRQKRLAAEALAHQTAPLGLQAAVAAGDVHLPATLLQALPDAPSAAALDLETAPEAIGRALKLETYRLQKAKAELANLELDKAAGLLVERAEVDFVLADLGNTLRGLLEAVPDRLTPVLEGVRGDRAATHQRLEEHMRELLETITDHLTRKLEEVTR